MLCLQVLTDDPGDNTYGHTPLHIQTGDGKRYIVLFAGHPVVIAGVSYRIDTVGEAHIDNALVDICDTTGILALDTALLQVVPVGILGNTLDVSLDAQVLQTVAPHAENTDQKSTNRDCDSGWKKIAEVQRDGTNVFGNPAKGDREAN